MSSWRTTFNRNKLLIARYVYTIIKYLSTCNLVPDNSYSDYPRVPAAANSQGREEKSPSTFPKRQVPEVRIWGRSRPWVVSSCPVVYG